MTRVVDHAMWIVLLWNWFCGDAVLPQLWKKQCALRYEPSVCGIFRGAELLDERSLLTGGLHYIPISDGRHRHCLDDIYVLDNSPGSRHNAGLDVTARE